MCRKRATPIRVISCADAVALEKKGTKIERE
jgi:hypothetical protein